MTGSVLTLLDRFTVSTAEGHPSMYTSWVRIPDWCQHAEIRFECVAFNNGTIEAALETSMDRVHAVELFADVLDNVKVLQEGITWGLGRYVRVRLTARDIGTKPNMVISAYLLLRTAT